MTLSPCRQYTAALAKFSTSGSCRYTDELDQPPDTPDPRLSSGMRHVAVEKARELDQQVSQNVFNVVCGVVITNHRLLP